MLCQIFFVHYVAGAILCRLDAGISNAISCAWRENTKRARSSQWRQFMTFCENLDLVSVPADSRTVARFLVMKAETCKFSTINNYLSAIIVLQKCYGYQPHYREEFMICLVLDGLRSILGTGVTQKMPLTPQELLPIFRMIDPNDEVGMIYWSVIVFCFRTILRKSNVVPESGNLDDLLVRRNCIHFHAWGMMINVLSTKTIKYRERVLEIPICYIHGSPFCAVSLLKSHFSKYPGVPDGPLFYKMKGKLQVPVKYQETLSYLKKMSFLIGKDPSTIELHSLRRSGAFFMHQIGVPLEDIKCIGDWKSLAALMYIVSPLERKKTIDKVVASALPV